VKKLGRLELAGAAVAGLWEVLIIALDALGRLDALKEVVPAQAEFLFDPLFRDATVLFILVLWLHNVVHKQRWWPRFYRKNGLRYRMVSYSLAIAIGAVVGGTLAATIWSREAGKFVNAKENQAQVSEPAITVPDLEAPSGSGATYRTPPSRPDRSPNLAQMRDLYVRYCELKERRSDVYGEYIAAMVQSAVHTSSANNIVAYPPAQREAVEEQARRSVEKENTEREKTYQVDQELMKLLAQIIVTYPATPELKRLIAGASSRPSYTARRMTREEDAGGAAAFHAYNQEQGALATTSMTNELGIPMESLRQYLEKQLDKSSAR
jgi:hypothetical protein